MRRRRRRAPVSIDDVDFPTVLDLESGVSKEELRRSPGREAELRAIWSAVGDVFLPSPTCPDGHGDTDADCYRSPPGQRPWGWWHFEVGRERPATPMAQLTELQALGLFLGSWEQEAAERYIRWSAVHRVRVDSTARADPTDWRVEWVADELGVSPAQVCAWLAAEEVLRGGPTVIG